MNDFKEKIKTCMQHDPPPCEVSCPFNFDIREFITKTQRGAFNGAYRIFANAVAFPKIVRALCPKYCQSSCVFDKVGRAINLPELEQATFMHASNTKPNSYNVPTKPHTIAVIGGGISGLACALRLCAKKYRVIVYEQRDEIGGSLHDVMKAELFLKDIKNQFQFENVEICLNTKITNLLDINADAIYIATGANGDKFGANESSEGAYSSNIKGVFLGGQLIGSDLMHSIADGLAVINSIERYLKVGSMNQPIVKKPSRFTMDISSLTVPAPVIPTGEGYSKEKAIAESKRCLKCQCDACIKNCDLMNGFNKFPKRIDEEVEITVIPSSLSREARVATRLIGTCNHCGLCKNICPLGIDVGAFLLESHREMKRQNAMPFAFHEFYIRDMEFSNSEESAVCKPSPNKGISSYAFFPGCRLGASNNDYVLKSYSYLLNRLSDVSLMLLCCGAPAEWGGDAQLHSETIKRIETEWIKLGKPTLIFACTTCVLQIKQHLPQITATTLYEIMAEDDSFALPQLDINASVFDPCSSRDFPEVQSAVRLLLQKSNLTLEPLPEEKEHARCCSWGGQTAITNPAYTNEVIRRRINQSDMPYITYCANCRDIFVSRDKETVHILDILFKIEDMTNTEAFHRPAPMVTESRENRRNLKTTLLKHFWNEKEEDSMESKIQLEIPPELLQKLSREMLLTEDLQEVIAYCEETGKKIYDSELNAFYGHKKVGNFTVWVTYRPIDNGFLLQNAYAHRMTISED